MEGSGNVIFQGTMTAYRSHLTGSEEFEDHLQQLANVLLQLRRIKLVM
jgi:hypothetical protein